MTDLAARLEHWADWNEGNTDGAYDRPGTGLNADLRLAAARLRHLDRILDAGGDLNRGWTVREGLVILCRIADAFADGDEQ